MWCVYPPALPKCTAKEVLFCCYTLSTLNYFMLTVTYKLLVDMSHLETCTLLVCNDTAYNVTPCITYFVWGCLLFLDSFSILC